MVKDNGRNEGRLQALPKTPTGISGFDELTAGGLPRGRTSLIAGGPGCGKTLFGLEFLVRGITQYGENGVFIAFEETPDDLAANVTSFGFDLKEMIDRRQLAIDHIRIERSEIEETGEYDLEGLFVRLAHAIDSVGAKRVVIDTLEALFGGLSDSPLLRSELRRLFRWLKDRGVTAIVTAERGSSAITRHGLEEYVSDCVIVLDHRIHDQITTRRLRVVKYRGSAHGTNEYPFLIDEKALSVFPVTGMGLDYAVSREQVSTGVQDLDAMLAGGGYYRGSSILVSGTAGSGKTSLAAHFVNAACARGERCLYLAFEESSSQLTRNMESIGIGLKHWMEKGLLNFHSARPTVHGLEMHLAVIYRLTETFEPRIVVMDPATNLNAVGRQQEITSALTRLLDFVKSKQITILLTSLTGAADPLEQSGVDVSSWIDTWILARNHEAGGQLERELFVLKSRGMNHSNQVRRFQFSSKGIELLKPVGKTPWTAGPAESESK